MIRVKVKPELLRWARARADMDADMLVQRFPKYREWENEKAQPTLKQLEKFAKTVHVPIGSLFLSNPPDEPIPIPDFRTVGNSPLKQPSLDLLDTIYVCQQRQAWYQDFARIDGRKRLPFIGSVTLKSNVEMVATNIRSTLNFDLEKRRALSTWTDALRQFIEMADELGILVMVSGVVGNNTHRRLNPDEFRGFALVDDLAPVIFINGKDTKSAQMFTLSHELAHLWLGQSALSDSHPASVPSHEVEAWCNKVAAEFLVPLVVLREEYRRGEDLPRTLARLARRFKVSTLVILRRIHDAGNLSRKEFQEAYSAELKKLQALKESKGGDFYPTEITRVGKRFAHALVSNTLEGGTSFTESFRLLGFRKMKTFNELAKRLGVLP